VSPAEKQQLFAAAKTIAVVGLSARPDRPSFDVSRVMQRAGFRIIPVNPAYTGQQILGETCVATLADVPVAIDIVDCFRRSEEMVPVARDAAALNPRPAVLWMQIGVVNPEAARIASDAGIQVVQNQCIKIEYFATR
jgi:predicted CoA-binding protein